MQDLPENRDAAIDAWRKGNDVPLRTLCENILANNGQDVFALTNLGVIRARAGNLVEAEALYQRGLAVAPEDSTLNANMAKLMLDRRQWTDAVAYCLRAVRVDPKHEIAWLNMSYAMFMQGNLPGAEQAARETLALNPRSDQAINNLANVLKDLSRNQESIALYRSAIEINPNNPLLYTNLALASMYESEVPVEEVVEIARRYARQFEDPLLPLRKPHGNVALPHRRLRVGFISPDFSNHAVMYFLEPVLMRLSRQDFELYAYYTYAEGDAITQRVTDMVDCFRLLTIARPAQAAEVVRNDRIDVLIDVAGHTAKNGLQVMAYKPAPVQITWLGYPGTTGLKAIDWRITDHRSDPPGVEATQYSEGLVRLPECFCVYRPHIRDLGHWADPRYQVQPPPALRQGHITFGSCNNIAKLSEPAVAAWAQILKRVPGSRLLIEGKDFSTETTANRLLARFARQGVDTARLILKNRDTGQQYLTYHQIDIALDTFPLTGGTTTFDALWMGVPVVTVAGRCFRERMSATILQAGGFAQDVCADVDAYVDRAVALAGNVDGLIARRLSQRATMQKSVLMDEPRFVRIFGMALRRAWQIWCAAQEPAVADAAPAALGELVLLDGKRINFLSARALLQQALGETGTPRPLAPPERLRELALALLRCRPEDAEAQAVLRRIPPVPFSGAT